MIAFKAAPRLPALVALGALLLAGPALAADESGYLGVMLQDLSPSMAKALQLDESSGVLINELVADGPAAKAGLRDGDVIVAFAGEPVADSGDLTAAVRATAPGTKVDVEILREGRRQTVAVELGERENTFTWVGEGGDFFPHGDEDVNVMVKRLREGDDQFHVYALGADRAFLGVHIDDLSPQLGEHFGVEDGHGVLVTEVVEDGPAAEAGLKAGDVIVRIGETEVEDTADLHKALAGMEAEVEIDIEYVRDGKKQSVGVTLGEAPAGDLESTYIFGDDDEFHIMAPKMMYRHMPPLGRHDVRVMRNPHRRIEVIREMDDAREDLQEMREELDKMRAELDALRKELNK
jgi:predicted metalloprotease with PDZ domain